MSTPVTRVEEATTASVDEDGVRVVRAVIDTPRRHREGAELQQAAMLERPIHSNAGRPGDEEGRLVEDVGRAPTEEDRHVGIDEVGEPVMVGMCVAHDE